MKNTASNSLNAYDSGRRLAEICRHTQIRRLLRRLGARSERHERYFLVTILGFSLLIQLALAPFHGFFVDMQYYVSWGQYLLVHPDSFYNATGANYPPLMMYIFADLDLTYTWIAHIAGLPPMYTALNATAAPQYAFMWLWTKLVTIFCNTATAVLIYKLVRPSLSIPRSLLVMSAYALAPTLLIDGALWGQTDGVPMLFLLLALFALRFEKFGWAGVSLSIMIMLKLQPVVFIPVVFWFVFLISGWRHLLELILAFAATIVIICLPMLLPFPPQLFSLVANTTSNFSLASANAFNLWFFVNPALLGPSPLIGPISASTIGDFLFAATMLLALAVIWYQRSVTTLYLALSLVAVSFFTVTAYQHERYMVQSLAVLLLAAASYRPCLRYFIIASITSFYNVFAIAIPEASPVGAFTSANALLSHLPSGTESVACWISLELLFALIFLCLRYMKSGSTPGPSPAKLKLGQHPQESADVMARPVGASKM